RDAAAGARRSPPRRIDPEPGARVTQPGEAAEPPLLEARGLVREYGGIAAVDGIDFALPAGAFLAVFGPNGAGKTSLLRMLAGGLRPTRGEVWVAGQRLEAGSPEGRQRIGVLSHQTFL